MRIGFLTLAGPWGGTQIHTLNLARSLTARGHAVTVVCVAAQSFAAYRDHGADVDVAYRPVPTAPAAMSFRQWRRYFAGNPWDLCILVKGDIDAGSAQLDLAARWRFGNYLTIEHLTADAGPRTSRRHFGVVPGLGLWWYRARLRRFLRSVGPRTVVCVSSAVRRCLVEEYRFPARKTLMVANGIDVERFRPYPGHAAAWRQRWGFASETVVLGAVGRLHPRKGYDTALTGFQTLLQRFPDKDLRLVLVGEGQQEPALRAQAERITPAGRVTFWPFCDRPWEPLAAFDVFVLPSHNEGLPLALLEAMASGCCSVASAVGGVPEVLTRADLGWLVPARDDAAFAAAMIDAVSRTADERAAMGRRAREHVIARFDKERQFSVLADVVESCASSAPSARSVRVAAPAPKPTSVRD